MERERNLACNEVIVAVHGSIYCTVEQKCTTSPVLSAPCQFVAFACGEELARQLPDVPWTSYAVPPGPGLVLGFFSLKQNPFFH